MEQEDSQLSGTEEDDGGIGAEVETRLDELFADEDEDPGRPAYGDMASGDPDIPPETVPGQFGENLEMAGQKSDDLVGQTTAASSADATGTQRDEPGRADHSLQNLKALVSEIEWEISDEIMSAFLREVALLQKSYHHDSVRLMFLKLHESIGKYIQAKKARAHPDAIKIVSSVFRAFSKTANEPGMPVYRQKKLLSAEVQVFKEFKQRVQGGKKQPADDHGVPESFAQKAVEPPVKLASREDMVLFADYIVQQIRAVVADEVQKALQTLKTNGS